jgi:hypothetical protein
VGRGRRGGAGWGARPLRGQGAALGADPGGTERRRRGTLHIDPVTVGNIFVHAVALRAASGCVGGRRAHAGEGGEGEGSEGEGGAAGAGPIVLSGLGAMVRRSGARLTVSYQAWYVSGVHIEGNSSELDMPAVSSMQKYTGRRAQDSHELCASKLKEPPCRSAADRAKHAVASPSVSAAASEEGLREVVSYTVAQQTIFNRACSSRCSSHSIKTGFLSMRTMRAP